MERYRDIERGRRKNIEEVATWNNETQLIDKK